MNKQKIKMEKKREIRIVVLYAAHEIEYHDSLKLRFQFSTFDGSG
jgi:hypothetical protein